MTIPTNQGCSLASSQRMLSTQLQYLWQHPDQAQQLPPLMLWGPPGVGKSAVVAAVCAQAGGELRDIRLSQREPVDLRGLPIPDGDQVRWLVAAEWPRERTSRGILFFDELSAADRSVQIAAYELILDRRLGREYQIPPGWLVVAAGNRSEDGCAAQDFPSALANRFCHLDLTPDSEEWLSWAQDAGIDPLVRSFIRFRPALLCAMEGACDRGWPSPRSWQRVSTVLQMGWQAGLDDPALQLMISGLVGPAACEFAAYARLAQQLPDANALLEGRAAGRVPQRPDQCHAWCCAVVHHLCRQPTAARIGRFLAFTLGLPSHFAAMCMLDALRFRDGALAAQITGHSAFPDWVARHGRVFTSKGGRLPEEAA